MNILAGIGRTLALLLLVLAVTYGPSAEEGVAASTPVKPTLDVKIWSAWRDAFVRPDGRVVDDANGGISHSESQGYGMLLATAADDRDSFDLIWNWTSATLGIREDNLFAWRYDPKGSPKIADRNNASDGDLLIAWALARAADLWNEPDYRIAAAAIARDVQMLTVVDAPAGRVLMPGADGFDRNARKDGPVVNLSYWVFPAFFDLAPLTPEQDWEKLVDSGLNLTVAARFGKRNLPTDWIALGGGRPAPAAGFAPEFAWNAIRVPLYIAWFGGGERTLLAPFAAMWPKGGASDPMIISMKEGAGERAFGGPDYRAVPALVACALDDTPLPDSLKTTTMDHYYPATLRLLVLTAAAERYPSCL